MKKTILAALALAAGISATPAVAGPVEIGILRCQVVGGVNFVVGSNRDLDCYFTGKSGKVRDHYLGRASRIGVDLGTATTTNLAWLVFAPVYNTTPGALEGGYGGVSAEATLGAGIGANALIGGFGKSIILNPVSLQAQTGVNLAAGIAGLNLTKTR